MSIRFEQVAKRFGSKVVLDKISFEVKTGEILFILGKSGVGKSVTLKHIVGMLHPDSGHVWVNNRDVTALTKRGDRTALAEIRRICGMVFQQPALLDSLTVYENVAFGLRQATNPPPEAEIRKRVIETLGYVHLHSNILERVPPEISYGMQKRVSLARTLAPGPQYLLFDEPTTGLDPITTESINALILNLSKQLQVTSIVVSHDMNSALKVADRILVLDQGKILAIDTPSQILKSKTPLIRDFLSEVNPS